MARETVKQTVKKSKRKITARLNFISEFCASNIETLTFASIFCYHINLFHNVKKYTITKYNIQIIVTKLLIKKIKDILTSVCLSFKFPVNFLVFSHSLKYVLCVAKPKSVKF